MPKHTNTSQEHADAQKKWLNFIGECKPHCHLMRSFIIFNKNKNNLPMAGASAGYAASSLHAIAKNTFPDAEHPEWLKNTGEVSANVLAGAAAVLAGKCCASAAAPVAKLGSVFTLGSCVIGMVIAHHPDLAGTLANPRDLLGAAGMGVAAASTPSGALRAASAGAAAATITGPARDVIERAARQIKQAPERIPAFILHLKEPARASGRSLT